MLRRPLHRLWACAPRRAGLASSAKPSRYTRRRPLPPTTRTLQLENPFTGNVEPVVVTRDPAALVAWLRAATQQPADAADAVGSSAPPAAACGRDGGSGGALAADRTDDSGGDGSPLEPRRPRRSPAATVWGLDAEWRAHRRHARVATVQLAARGTTLVLQMARIGDDLGSSGGHRDDRIPRGTSPVVLSELRELLESPHHLKARCTAGFRRAAPCGGFNPASSSRRAAGEEDDDDTTNKQTNKRANKKRTPVSLSLPPHPHPPRSASSPPRRARSALASRLTSRSCSTWCARTARGARPAAASGSPTAAAPGRSSTCSAAATSVTSAPRGSPRSIRDPPIPSASRRTDTTSMAERAPLPPARPTTTTTTRPPTPTPRPTPPRRPPPTTPPPPRCPPPTTPPPPHRPPLGGTGARRRRWRSAARNPPPQPPPPPPRLLGGTGARRPCWRSRRRRRRHRRRARRRRSRRACRPSPVPDRSAARLAPSFPDLRRNARSEGNGLLGGRHRCERCGQRRVVVLRAAAVARVVGVGTRAPHFARPTAFPCPHPSSAGPIGRPPAPPTPVSRARLEGSAGTRLARLPPSFLSLTARPSRATSLTPAPRLTPHRRCTPRTTLHRPASHRAFGVVLWRRA